MLKHYKIHYVIPDILFYKLVRFRVFQKIYILSSFVNTVLFRKYVLIDSLSCPRPYSELVTVLGLEANTGLLFPNLRPFFPFNRHLTDLNSVPMEFGDTISAQVNSSILKGSDFQKINN